MTIYKYGASDARYHADRPNDLLMSSAIRAACRDGSRIFDFGRSELTATGLRAFEGGGGGGGDRGEKIDGAGLVGSVLTRTPTWVTRAVGEILYRYAA